jgi:predicted regulator of Ras-like GTPase activity (Roadblock/LC7/MglB family)
MSPTAELDPGVLAEAGLQAELHRLEQMCVGLRGAAIATNDGLAMCARGVLLPDEASAAAAFVLGEVASHLQLLRAGRLREVMAWTDTGPCYIARISSMPYVIALFASAATPAGALRHAGALASARLAPLLAGLGEPLQNTTEPS